VVSAGRLTAGSWIVRLVPDSWPPETFLLDGQHFPFSNTYELITETKVSHQVTFVIFGEQLKIDLYTKNALPGVLMSSWQAHPHMVFRIVFMRLICEAPLNGLCL